VFPKWPASRLANRRFHSFWFARKLLLDHAYLESYESQTIFGRSISRQKEWCDPTGATHLYDHEENADLGQRVVG
jgi:hypothetical protein